MATLDMIHIDLKSGRRSTTAGGEEVGSVCFSDEFCNSQLDDSKASSVDLEIGIEKIENNNLINLERDCRICHLSLISNSHGPGPDSGFAIELGCSCKDDLAAAHKNCAESWFKIKGNKTCEICNSVARNVVGPIDTEVAQQATESAVAVNTPPSPMPSTTETRTCLNGHQILNFLLACMVFGFVISWLFDLNIFL
ncbi:hypothetical protein CASFOL_017365 [Castilleja foliolosa]|uniref:RING-CH-type domain-containing protein n=1 Tax=Castilleja foliolosa TaxID=1961234 RepID=A0ABD3DBD0_9LAMI